MCKLHSAKNIPKKHLLLQLKMCKREKPFKSNSMNFLCFGIFAPSFYSSPFKLVLIECLPRFGFITNSFSW